MAVRSTALRALSTAILAFLALASLAVPSVAAPGATIFADAETPAPMTSSEGVGIRLLDAPVDTLDDPRAQSYIVDHVNPGTTIERRVEIANESSKEHAVRVYSAAAKVVDGSFVPNDESANELSTWTRVGEEPADEMTVELAPGEKAAVPVTIDVPGDAPEGEQYAAVWAEVRNESGKGSEVALANRAGVRIYLSVGPGNGPPADFEIGTLTAGRSEDGLPIVTAEVTNTGGRAVDITGELTLADGPGGLSAGPFVAGGATTLAPGSSGEVRIELDPEIPNGPWQATLDLSSGLVEKQATGEITFPEAGESTEVDIDQWMSPWWWLVGALVLALLVLGAVAWRRRKSGSSVDA